MVQKSTRKKNKPISTYAKEIKNLIKEKSALSSLDGIFLFSFTVILFIFSLLNIYVGSVGGLLLLLIGVVCAFPFYVAIYCGIMQDDVSERLAAWKFMLFVASMVVLASGEFFIITPVNWLMLYGASLGQSYVIGTIIFIALAAVIALVIALIFLSIWSGLLVVFKTRLPDRSKETSGKGIMQAFSRHALVGGLFVSTTILLTFSTLTEGMKYFFSPLIFTFPSDPYSLIIMFAVLWIWAFLMIRVAA